MKHYPFPKIRQYHQVLRDLKLKAQFSGFDINGDPIYDSTKELPIVSFEGFVKLHGTNAAIVINSDETYYCQSRENVIDQMKDNAGFAHWVAKDGHKIIPHFKPSDATKTVIYGEWCGGSIQSRVALNSMPKMFVIFGVKQVVSTDPIDGETNSLWMITDYENPTIGVFNIRRTKPYILEVDLNHPDKAIEIMNRWVDTIDKNCPFAKTFDISGHGEGIVFRPMGEKSFSRAFKVKGSSHSKASKEKKLPTVDVVKLDSIHAALELYCTEDRLQQGYNIVVPSIADAIPQKISDFIRWVIDDIWDEESDALLAADISRKEISSAVSKIAAAWFQNKLKISI